MFTNTKKASEILEITKHQPANTLFVFDVDNVLSITQDLAIQQNWRIYDLTKEYCISKKKTFDWNKYEDLIFFQAKKSLVEPEMLDVIKYLEINKLPTIALTHCDYQSIKGNPNYSSWADWRYRCLKEVDVDFKKLSQVDNTFLDNGYDLFSKSKFDFFGWFQKSGHFFNGITLTGGSDKGDCLEATLKLLEMRPSKVVFIDDHEWNLESVHSMCARNNIEFQGIHYTQAEELHSSYTPHKKREELQVQFLVEKNVWLSDTQADELINADYKLIIEQTEKQSFLQEGGDLFS